MCQNIKIRSFEYWTTRLSPNFGVYLGFINLVPSLALYGYQQLRYEKICNIAFLFVLQLISQF